MVKTVRTYVLSLRDLRAGVFWPPFLLLILSLIISICWPKNFFTGASYLNQRILNNFDWLFSYGTLFMLASVFIVYFSHLGKVKIGGSEAQPMISRWAWFSITICTTVAIGILFWATAEPIYHLHQPPVSLGLTPGSPEALLFSLSTMYLHWTFTPYAIYCIPALAFTLAYYNYGYAFSLSSAIKPLLGQRIDKKTATVIDSICLFSLVLGMSASLGAGVLTMLGAGKIFLQIPQNTLTIGIVTSLVVMTFVASSISGLLNGIRFLSDLNIKVFFVIGGAVLFFGPTWFILEMGGESFWYYLTHFFSKSTFLGDGVVEKWPQNWTVFYWANWFSWAPITAMFLGRIAYGYTVRQFIHMNLVAPALFGCLWMAIFSSSAIFYDQQSQGNFLHILQNTGPEAIIYAVLEELPLSGALIALFVVASFLSYVTAADSNTDAMSGICTRGVSPDGPSPPMKLKIIWGFIIGLVTWIMVSFAGIDGIKMLSNLGGLPALFLILLINVSLLRQVFFPKDQY